MSDELQTKRQQVLGQRLGAALDAIPAPLTATYVTEWDWTGKDHDHERLIDIAKWAIQCCGRPAYDLVVYEKQTARFDSDARLVDVHSHGRAVNIDTYGIEVKCTAPLRKLALALLEAAE